jgi:septum site-determining protein MinD
LTKFVVVASSKGGVGKTTTAINLGTALTQFSKDVIVVDCNLSTPNISLYLGAPHVPITLHDVIKHNKKITDALYIHNHGLKIIPASPSIKDWGDIDYEVLSKLIKSLSGMADYVIIDSAAGINDEAVNALKLGDELLIVTTPELPSVSDALRTIKLAHKHGKEIKGIILTRVYEDELELTKDDVEAILEHKVIGIIPEDETIRESVKMKHPVTHSHPNSPVALGYKQLAADLLGEKYVESIEKKESMFDYALKRFGLK